MKFIDIHCHLNFPEYDQDREEVIARIQKEEIGVMNVGTDIDTSKKAVELAHAHKNMWATVGIHPTHTEGELDFATLEKLAGDPRVVAIGECGLDYFRSEAQEFEKQREVFLRHIELANKVNKPLMLHVRDENGSSRAYEEALKLLKQYAKVRANFHFFAGTLEDAKNIFDINGTVSFTGVVTFARNYDEVIKYVPSDRIMSETDAPFVAPTPYRGKRNEPLYIKEIVASLASIRGETADKFAEQIIDNARKMFSI